MPSSGSLTPYRSGLPKKIKLQLTFAQMKLFNAIAAAAVIAASFVTANPAEARNGWVTAAESTDAVTTHIKKVDFSGRVRKFYMNNVGPGARGVPFLAEADCSGWTMRPSGVDQWIDVMPGSVNEESMKIICR